MEQHQVVDQELIVEESQAGDDQDLHTLSLHCPHLGVAESGQHFCSCWFIYLVSVRELTCQLSHPVLLINEMKLKQFQ